MLTEYTEEEKREIEARHTKAENNQRGVLKGILFSIVVFWLAQLVIGSLFGLLFEISKEIVSLIALAIAILWYKRIWVKFYKNKPTKFP